MSRGSTFRGFQRLCPTELHYNKPMLLKWTLIRGNVARRRFQHIVYPVNILCEEIFIPVTKKETRNRKAHKKKKEESCGISLEHVIVSMVATDIETLLV